MARTPAAYRSSSAPVHYVPTDRPDEPLKEGIALCLSGGGYRDQERLVNWGYAICDAALRKHVDERHILPCPKDFPYPRVGVG